MSHILTSLDRTRNPEPRSNNSHFQTATVSSLHVALAVGMTDNHDQRLSLAVARCLANHAIISHEYLPDLSEADWLVIADVCNGILNLPSKLHNLPAMVFEDGVAAAKSLGVDHRRLARQLSTFGMAERIAIAEFVHRFWTWHWLHDDASCIEEVVARVKESIRLSARIVRDLDPPDPN